jgi:hypothetical protein
LPQRFVKHPSLDSGPNILAKSFRAWSMHRGAFMPEPLDSDVIA